jgi:hypothetical protein
MNERSSTSRCDRIVALIDECLADVDSTMRSIAGDGHAGASRPHVPARHLDLVRSS